MPQFAYVFVLQAFFLFVADGNLPALSSSLCDLHRYSCHVLKIYKNTTFGFIAYFFGGLERVGHSFAYVAHFFLFERCRSKQALPT
jgi:hypothetical protein